MSNSMIVKGTIAILILGIVLFSFAFFKKKRKEIALLITSSVIALLIGELLLRMFWPQITEYGNMFTNDSTLGWKFISNGKGRMVHPGATQNTIETNSLGFRDHAPSPDKKKKLLVLGDSFVSNISVKDEDVFTEIMEGRLKNYDVLNFGVNGYGQVQEYLLLKKWLHMINPEVVILVIYLQNDFADNSGDYWLYPRPYASLDGKDSILTLRQQSKDQRIKNYEGPSNLLSKSHLNRLITRTINNLLSKPDSLYIATEFYSCRWPISEDYHLRFRIMEELLLKIATLGKEKDVPVVFALVPSILQVEDELWELFLEKNSKARQSYIRSLPNDQLMQFAKQNHLFMIDFLPVFIQESKNNIKLYNPIEQHWTKDGNRFVASSLIDFLKSNSLIE
jgi:hypothetical protein